jgi:hypothetical protein
MSRTRRRNRRSAPKRADNIVNTRTMGNERLCVFIDEMEIPNNYREALVEHLGIPSERSRVHPPRLDVITQRVGNVKQHRTDMVSVGTRYAASALFFFTSRS